VRHCTFASRIAPSHELAATRNASSRRFAATILSSHLFGKRVISLYSLFSRVV
jgi:hypothetical protein